jgi:hypothetical protein
MNYVMADEFEIFMSQQRTDVFHGSAEIIVDANYPVAIDNQAFAQVCSQKSTSPTNQRCHHGITMCQLLALWADTSRKFLQNFISPRSRPSHSRNPPSVAAAE